MSTRDVLPAARRTRVAQFSGGITSWAVARRIAIAMGWMTLFFCSLIPRSRTKIYTFVETSAAQLGARLVRVADGRTPWQVFEDKQRLGNSLLAPCSYALKIRPCRRWLTAHTDPANTVLYVRIDNSPRDRRRAPAIERGWSPWRVEFPLLGEPDLSKAELLTEARAQGLRPPRAYALGFDHANCGQLCVRGGQKYWLRTLECFPDRFADYEAREQRFRQRTGKDVAILRERRAGRTIPLPLSELRRRHQVAEA